jgi:PTH1 family peptidyl-tRNA hydrolase
VRKAVVGLGNPGTRYAETRHNVGFMVVDRLASRLSQHLSMHSDGARWVAGRAGDVEVLLVEPQELMNLSGRSVARLCGYRAIEPADVLVAHDELDLALGRIQLKRGGGTAGHRGLASIVEEIGPGFHRLRFGVGRPPDGADAIDFVLGRFSDAERAVVAPELERAAEAALCWIEFGLEAAMRRFNVRGSSPAPPAEA